MNNTCGKPTALIVDDEESICKTLAGVLSDEGWASEMVYSGADAILAFKDRRFNLVFLDVWMKHLDGLQTLQKLKEINSRTPVVIMSGHGKIETAVKATKLGAYNFLEKPLSLEKILPILEFAKKIDVTEAEVLNGSKFSRRNYELIGSSAAIGAVHRQIKSIAKRNSWVLITGENGTGKEVVARNIHLHSQRADKNFVAVNCAAIPEELIESELFGHVKGAFTDATALKIGKFELANHGTLFLDEIGDMSLKTQAKILRILQEQSFQRLGDNATISIDVRVVAATNKNLAEEIRNGTFREDLYYRLNVVPIFMVPLRDRKDDISVLVEHFLGKIAYEFKETPKVMSAGAVELFKTYYWPGNVRELKNMIERLCIVVGSDLIVEADVREVFAMADGSVSSVGNNIRSDYGDSLKEARSAFERSFIVDKLEECNWNISKTAELIGLERSNLHRKLRLYDIALRGRR